jgi:hypothetical protein
MFSFHENGQVLPWVAPAAGPGSRRSPRDYRTSGLLRPQHAARIGP